MREASLPQHAPLVTASRQLPQTSCLCKSDGEPVTGLMSMHLAKHQVSKITVQVDPLLETWTGAPDFFSFTRKFFFSPESFFLTRKCSSRPSHSCSCSGKRCHALSNMRRMLFFRFQSSCFGVNGKEWWLWFITVALYSTWFIIFLILYVFVFSILI